ncbi:uncharacterized protein LOC133319056 [Danaus plexippus]|uniref:uncharacterized protein LOC133319056 n=1 Tax=Danaus plexippus TaxID=13037 RepID=UPI002AB29B2E|nr:uncharacterized protein LOC133319056 [Danaus plexippus]
MKTVRKMHTGLQNCSCTSCIYKSGSENASVKRFMEFGSRIDRLYFGKYIPLRERKLLERLVRTRAEYDDIRARLISDSTHSLSTKATKKSSRELDDVEKGSAAILELVNLVDKGATLGLSECCSCCSCDSKGIRGNVRHMRRGHGLERRVFKEERIAETHRRRKGVRFKTKHIKSDPCTCTLKLSSHLKHHATEVFRRKHHPESTEFYTTTDEERQHKQRRVRDFVHRSYENIKHVNKEMEQKFLEGVKKVKESKTKIQENLNLDTQYSAVQLKKARKSLKSKVRGDEKRQSYKSDLQLNDLLAICMCSEDEIFEKPHESLLSVYTRKSKEKFVEAKGKLKSVVKSTVSRKPKVKKVATKGSQIEIAPEETLGAQLKKQSVICICPEDKSLKKSLKESSFSIHTKRSKEKVVEAKEKLKSIVKSTVSRKQKERKISSKGSQTQIAPENNLAAQLKKESVICICPEEQPFKKPRRGGGRKISTRTSETQFARGKDLAFQVKKDSLEKFKEDLIRKQIMKEWECGPECIEGPCDPQECLIKLERKRKNKGVTHRGIEYRQVGLQKTSGPVIQQKHAKVQEELMFLPPKGKQKPILRTQQAGGQAVQIASGGQFDMKQKNKIISKRERVDKRMSTKIVKTPEKKPSSRQGVRISSSFSLKVQFYKGTPNAEISKPNETATKQSASGTNNKIIKHPKVFHEEGIRQVVTKHSSRDTQTRARSLKRCFCTLKLKSKAKNRKRNKPREKSIFTETSSVTQCNINCSTEMCEQLLCEKLYKKSSKVQTTNPKTNRHEKKFKSPQLLPYECEPGVCIPDECDPYQCIQLINLREAKARRRSIPCSTCTSRKTKSTSTITSKSNKLSKAKFIQSMYSYNAASKRNETTFKIQQRNIPHTSGRQAVRIASSFSFNIEFHKNKPGEYLSHPPDLKTISVQPQYRAIPKRKKAKVQAFQEDAIGFHQNMPTQMYRKAKDVSMSTALKRCFCTLKIQKKEHLKIKKNKMLTVGTKTVDELYFNTETSNKATKTKKKYMRSLEPYECEPFTCIPGQCNPYECLERINRRHLRDVGVSSLKYPDVNRGSSTSEKSYRSELTQLKPKFKPKKVSTKGKKLKQAPKVTMASVENYSNYSSSARSRQAVRISSTFSFNVEFYKNKPDKDVITDYQMRPASKLDSRPDTKNQGVKIKKLNVANLDTQVNYKQRNKASATKPLLKRCFCTLNLQKRRGYVVPPNVYTVNTAMIKENKFSIFKPHRSNFPKISNSAMPNEKIYNLSHCLINSLSKGNSGKNIEKISCKRCYSMNDCKHEALELITQTRLPKKDLRCRKVSHEQFSTANTNLKRYVSLVNQESITYTSTNYKKRHTALERIPYMKGYFCTMNLQVQTNNMIMRNQKRSNRYRKLKPYECEPGVCVPGECDPYECLKLISKRGSNFTRKTGTENIVASESSYTNLSPKYRSYKMQSLSQKITKPHLIQHEDQYSSGSKKAVRLGSKFSFDIEFSKNSPGAQIDHHITPHTLSKTEFRHPRRLSKITGINKIRYRDRQSQSTLGKTFQKASATLPIMKRCFCTLKLQKKGRLLRHDFKNPTEALQTEPITPQLITTDRGQNTAKLKPTKLLHALEPYECMPGMCSPGECNPYECLEIMNRMKRNQTVDFGINALGPRSKSAGSMYDFYRKNKNRGVNVRHKVANRPTFFEGRHRQRDRQVHLMEPERQAVRISSSFKFDIEFRKGNASAHPEDYKNAKDSRENHMPHFKKRFVRNRQSSSETLYPKHHKKLQIKDKVHAASTMTTSFMKRCFCVLKLKKKNRGIMNDINEEKFPKPVYIDKKINTRHYTEPVLQLEPYECEPGICIPGKCNPYVCEKLIKRRLQSTASGTPLRFTRSVSSSSPRSYMRNVNTQLHPKRKFGDLKRQVYTKTRIQDSNRQVVRIGSNFRFDIEFYKNKPSNEINDYNPKPHTDERLHFERKRRQGRNMGTHGHSPSFRSHSSQTYVNRRDFGAGLNNVLKRCFCTLQLYNQRSKKYMARKPRNAIKNEVHSKSVMTAERNKLNFRSLEPYECEPNFCIPYKCDPYVCEQRIKLRQRKNLRQTGMSTELSTQSVGSYTRPFGRSRRGTQSIVYKNRDKFKRPKTQTIHNTQSKQCVRIGSSFSFDIEFFKNKGGGLQLDQKPKHFQPRQSFKQFAKGPRRIKARNKGFQYMTPSHGMESQVNNKFTKTQSTMARFAQPLKRCFCTFYLKKNKARSHPIPKPLQINVSTETMAHDFKTQPLQKLLPYECEPNFCVPYECDPLECLEHIKARQRHQKDYGTSTNYLQKNRIGTSMDMPHTKNKRLQWKSLGHIQNKGRYKQPLTSDPAKQVVRIGSNFSFNLEFYKQKGSGGFENNISEHNKPMIQKRRPLHLAQTQKVNRYVNNRHNGYRTMRSHGNQSPHVGRESKGSGIEPFLKRCFCTLKLQKKAGQRNQYFMPDGTKNNVIGETKPRSLTFDKGTITKRYRNYPKLSKYECEPNTCIPGECDPYECLKRIKERNLYSRGMTTQMMNSYCSRGICTDLANLKSKKLQSNRFGDIVNVTRNPNVVEIPRFENIFNPQAVKIGSNISFNIEFYKEQLPPNFETKVKGDKIYEKHYEAKEKIPRIKYNTNAVTACPRGICLSKGSQGYRVPTDNKAVEIGNALKRCFCTLKLQKELNSNRTNTNNQNVPFPQTFEVRRVGVQNKKNVTKPLNEVNSVGTNTKAKYLKKGNQEMEVIHPYSPKKFNKTKSKTKFDKPEIDRKVTPKKSNIKSRGKRLTKKKSKRALSQSGTPSKQSMSKLKKFMCICAQIFTNKSSSEKQDITNKKLSQKNQTVNSAMKKNTKVGEKTTIEDNLHSQNDNIVKCHDTCAHYVNHPVADNAQLNPTISIKMKKKHKHFQIHQNKLSKNAQSKSEHQKDKSKEFNENSIAKNENYNSLCPHCENVKMKKQRSQPLKVHFEDSPIVEKKDLGGKMKNKDGLTHLNKSVDQIDKHKKNYKNKKIRVEVPARKTPQYCKFCTTCGTKLNNEEIQKASGDQRSVKNYNKDKDMNQSAGDKMSSTSDKIRNLFNLNQSVDNICSAKGPEPPLFEIQLDSDDCAILNKDEIIDKVRIHSKKTTREMKGKSSVKGHSKSCSCCICVAKRNKIATAVSVAGKTSKPTGKPCVCGSMVCAEKLEKMKDYKPTISTFRHVKPCDCGSPVCARESVKMSSISKTDHVTCVCEDEYKKQKTKRKLKENRLTLKQRALRLKIYDKEDKIRFAKRRKEEISMEKKINKNASDPILFAESVLDVGKLGVTAVTDIFRLFVRTAVDPKHAYQKLKDMKNDPSLMAKYLKSGIQGSGVVSTARRIRLRCLAMRGVKRVRSILESYPITNYLLYIASKDPRKRLPKRKPMKREQIDFSCSLYMASLRKRPFLSVYNKYPWFYPHFLSLLNVWRQFIDIALFLLAVVVWSPCILCMEACRAIMCCFFCTG